MTEWIQVAVTGLVGVLSVSAAIGAVVISRREASTSATDVFTDAAVQLIQPLRDRVAELETLADQQLARFRLLEQELEAAMRWGHALSAQLHDAMIDPITFAEIRRLDP